MLRFCEVEANKAAGCQFEEAIKCLGVELKPNLGTVKYEDFRIAEGRSGLGSAFEGPKKMGRIGGGVQGRYSGPHKIHFQLKVSVFTMLSAGVWDGAQRRGIRGRTL